MADPIDRKWRYLGFIQVGLILLTDGLFLYAQSFSNFAYIRATRDDGGVKGELGKAIETDCWVLPD